MTLKFGTIAYQDIIKILLKRGYIHEHTNSVLGKEGCLTQYIDYGHLGSLLLNNIRSMWMDSMFKHPNLHYIQTSSMNSINTLERSGHVKKFTKHVAKDLLSRLNIDVKPGIEFIEKSEHTEIPINVINAKEFFREHEEYLSKYKTKVERDRILLYCDRICVDKGRLFLFTFDGKIESISYFGYSNKNNNSPFISKPKEYTDLVQVELSNFNAEINNDSNSKCYLRPELAQGIFINYPNYSNFALPFGLFSVGKAFRNEIRPQHKIYKTVEFEQMEVEFFVPKINASKYHEFWLESRLEWWKKVLGNNTKIKTQEIQKNDLAHYAIKCTDIEYEFPFGCGEIEGVAYRGNSDLRSHFQDDDMPHVIECSTGLSRACLAIMLDSFKLDKNRVFMDLNPMLAPYKASVIPIVNKPEYVEMAHKLRSNLVKAGISSVVEAQGVSIGKKYMRSDEIGTPFCVTIDSTTMNELTVTIRDRNTTKQHRININCVTDYIANIINPERKGEIISLSKNLGVYN